MILIKRKDYSSLKNLFHDDDKAIKYRFPIVIIGMINETMLEAKMIHEPSKYIIKKQPWLKKSIEDDIKDGMRDRINETFTKEIKSIENKGLLNRISKIINKHFKTFFS